MTDTATAYHARITDYDGAVRTCGYTAAEADALIGGHLFDEDDVTPASDRSGRITIVRTIDGYRSAADTRTVPMRMTVQLTPAHTPRLSRQQFRDLTLIRGHESGSYGAVLDGERINVGFVSIAPARAGRLFERGWLTVGPWQELGKPVQRVTVSYAGRIAMALNQHRTSITVAPLDQWVTDALGGGEYIDGGSEYIAACSCSQWRSGRMVVRAVACERARAHRLEHLEAVFDLSD